MSELLNQPLPGLAVGTDGPVPATITSSDDAPLAPIVAFRGRPRPAERVKPQLIEVPSLPTEVASPEGIARAHGRPTRHRVRQPGAVGGVTVRAPLLDPTRTNVQPAVEGSRSSAHPRVGERRLQISRARRRTRLRPLLWPGVVALVLTGLFGVSFGSPLFLIRHVRTDFAGTAAQAAELRQVTGRLVGANIISFDGAGAARAIRSLPWVATVDVRRHLPGTVTMRVRAHDLAGAVALADGQFALAASDGVVIAIVAANAASMNGLARINLGSTPSLVPGDVLPSAAVDVLRGTSAVARLLPGRLATATLRQRNLTWLVRPLVGTHLIRVTVGSPTAGELAASALSSVLARPGQAPITIDLRTPDTPVLEIPATADL